jgi:hypothetical protein
MTVEQDVQWCISQLWLIRQRLQQLSVTASPSTGGGAVSSVFGRTGDVTAASNDYTEAQISFSDITTNDVSTSKHGFVPKITDTAKFLKGDGTWATPAGAGDVVGPAGATGGNLAIFSGATGKLIADGGAVPTTNATHTGEVTGATALTIANDAVTYAKMQNVSATDKVLGRSTAGSGDVEEIACTAAGRALLDDANAAAQIATLGITATAAELNIMDGVTATYDEINKVDGYTGTAANLNTCVSQTHATGSDTTLGSGCVAVDHGTAATDMVVNVCYGTGAAPTASTTTEGSIYLTYTA